MCPDLCCMPWLQAWISWKWFLTMCVDRKTKGYLSLYLFPPLPWPGRRPPQACALVFTQGSPLLSLSPWPLPCPISSPFLSLSPSHPGSEISPSLSASLSDDNISEEWNHLLSIYCVLATGLRWLMVIISFKLQNNLMFTLPTLYLPYSTCHIID